MFSGIYSYCVTRLEFRALYWLVLKKAITGMVYTITQIWGNSRGVNEVISNGQIFMFPIANVGGSNRALLNLSIISVEACLVLLVSFLNSRCGAAGNHYILEETRKIASKNYHVAEQFVHLSKHPEKLKERYRSERRQALRSRKAIQHFPYYIWLLGNISTRWSVYGRRCCKLTNFPSVPSMWTNCCLLYFWNFLSVEFGIEEQTWRPPCLSKWGGMYSQRKI